MALQKNEVEYRVGQDVFEGLLVRDDQAASARPGVMVCHAWAGRGAFDEARAEALARLGYVGFALDVYGKGVTGGTIEQNRALMTPLMEDRSLLLQRLQAGVQALRQVDDVDASKLAVIGFCFGGLCALDLARSGAELAGVVSFHGLLLPPPQPGGQISAKILTLHGWDDPMVPPETVLEFAGEMTGAGADWQLHAYGNTMHAFTNPKANDPDFGTVYNATAEQRSWQAMVNFLTEVLG